VFYVFINTEQDRALLQSSLVICQGIKTSINMPPQKANFLLFIIQDKTHSLENSEKAATDQ